ncbi:MAG: LysR family transcriptional regulator [Rhodobacteraceae bacterium]|nr:LysR family transcriptional regulator [Paracoccaceae bacterium]
MDLHRSDLGLLVSLDALLSERGVTAAAKRLGISQPALSAQLARLRHLFGDELLVGNAHGMVLTPRAEELRAPLHALLGDLRTLVSTETSFDPAQSTQVFRIGGTDLAHAILMPALLNTVRAQAPGARLAALPLVAGEVARRMDRDELDFAVVTIASAPEGFPALKLLDEDFCVIWREGHPEIGAHLTLDSFCAQPQLLVSPDGGGFHGVTDDALKKMGRARRVVGSLPSFLLAPAAVRSSDCLAVIPSRLAQLDETGLRSAPVPVETQGFTLYLSWHPRMKNAPAHRWMRELIRNQCR